MSTSDATVVMELTPPGRGAVAVVLVAGPEAVRAVDECFLPASSKRLVDLPVNRIAVGRWGAADGEEVVVCRRSDATIEVHCHGGVAAVRGVAERLRQTGCQPTRWQDWLRRSDADRIRAEAHVALADAPTARTAAVLVDQYHGALADAVRTALEAAEQHDWQIAVAALDAMLARRGVGLHLTAPWRVVLAGPPNVGKSSLLNALAGYQRAIVCDLPGTTRDVVTTTTAIDGWPVQLADTAGLRDTADELESAGVARAAAALAEADLVVLIDEPDGAASALPPPAQTPVLRVLNKIDLLSTTAPAHVASRRDVFTSALTGAGIDALVSAIGRALVPAPPAAGGAVPFTAEHVRRLADARAAAARRERAAVGASLRPLLGE